ncbi:TPA: DUF1283 domain-containing protein [Yersinia enterocolitica]
MKLQTGIRLALLLYAIINTPSMAHSGRTNADGCHTNRKTGEYHCHGAKHRQVDYSGQAESSDNKMTQASVEKTKLRSRDKKNGTGNAKSGAVSELRSVSTPSYSREQCINSKYLNAYWEPVTERCLDSSTGRVMTDLESGNAQWSQNSR